MRAHFDDFIYDSETRSVEKEGKRIALSAKAFQLLGILLESRPRAVAKQELFDQLWPDTFVSEANLASLIKEVRSALGDDAKEPRYVRTVHRHGYSFVGAVSEPPATRRPIDSIAVLPFENASGDAECDYLADGISATLVNSLSTLGGIRVAPRSASFRYRGGEVDLSRVRQELNVRAAVTGRLRLSGDQVELQVELTDLESEAQLWGAQYRAVRSDISRLHEALTSGVAAELKLRVSEEASSRMGRRYATSSEAYQAYLKGRHHWNRRTREGVERGIFYFQSALDIDDHFAPAWSGLADSYMALGSRDLMSPLPLYHKAEAAARRALEIDGELAEAHASMGLVREHLYSDWTGAERALSEALRLNPGYQTARQWFALCLAHQGKFDGALAQMSIATASDPLSFMLNSNGALIHYLARHFDAAEEHCMRALEINPHHEPAHTVLGLAHEGRGRLDEARLELVRSREITRGEAHVLAAIGHLGALEGKKEEAEESLTKLAQASVSRFVSPVHFALVLAALGEEDRAVAALEEALEVRSGWLVYLATDPRFDPLRENERFREIIQKVFG